MNGLAPALALLRLQTWLSPAFPMGAYCYSHGLEWAVEMGDVHDRPSLVDWLEADLRHGSGRNEAIFFVQAWRCARDGETTRLREVAELAASFRGTAELALESSQQGRACLEALRHAWPEHILDELAAMLCSLQVQPALAVVLGARLARERFPLSLALPAFLHSYTSSMVMAGLRLIPLGQIDGQLAIAELEGAVLSTSAMAQASTTADLGSAGLMVDFASMAHEIQYSRLFRS